MHTRSPPVPKSSLSPHNVHRNIYFRLIRLFDGQYSAYSSQVLKKNTRKATKKNLISKTTKRATHHPTRVQHSLVILAPVGCPREFRLIRRTVRASDLSSHGNSNFFSRLDILSSFEVSIEFLLVNRYISFSQAQNKCLTSLSRHLE